MAYNILSGQREPSDHRYLAHSKEILEADIILERQNSRNTIPQTDPKLTPRSPSILQLKAETKDLFTQMQSLEDVKVQWFI